jgi:steroid 17alpha-monooxygenase / 17alpha-hydroxyprogesterone deacetylase
MNNTQKALVGVIVGISTALLLKKIYNKLKAKRFKHPNEIKLKQESISEIEKLLVELKNRYPNECCLDIDGSKVILLNSIESIRKYSTEFGENLIANRPHFEIFDIISHNYLGSFFRMYDESLISIRRNSSNGLNRLVMNNPEFETKLFDELRMFNEFLMKQSSNDLENFQIYVQQFTANALVSIGIGVRFDYETSTTGLFREQIENMNAIFSSINVLNMIKYDEKMNSVVHKLVDKAYVFLQSALKAYLPKYNSQTINTFADFLLSKQEDIKKIRANLDKNDAYSDDDILVQFFTVFMAGSVSLGFAASWVFYYLSINPHIQQNILDEIQSLDSSDEFISFKMRSKMPYVEAFLHEALRLASVQPLIPRATLKQVQTNDISLSKDTIVLYNVYGMHHDEAHWHEPDLCKPERWLSEDKKTFSLAKSTVSFGNLPRKCIGEALSKNILFSMVVNITKKFQLKQVTQLKEVQSKVGVMRCPTSYKVTILNA